MRSCGTVRTQALLRAQSAPALEAIGEAVAESPANTRITDREIPMPAVLAAAHKP